MKKIKQITDDFEKANKKKKKSVKIAKDYSNLIPSGCTPFNLECSGRVEGAFLTGKIINLIGDSHAGKTLAALTMLAECTQLKHFDNHRLIYDDVEAACEFDIKKLFGKKLAKRIETDEDEQSDSIEDFCDRIARALEGEEPFIYVLDSFDSLTSDAEVKKEKENRKKREKGNEAKGDYGDGKPKIASKFFRMNKKKLHAHGSSIIIISQTRDNIGFGAMFNPKTRSGGKALKFYSFHEIWLACQKKEKDKKNKSKRTLVTNVQAKLTKNKLTGRHGEAFFPVLFDYGIDDITACINFLLDQKYWTGSTGSINTKGFYEDEKGKEKKTVTMKKLISFIEKNKKHGDLKLLCQIAYDDAIDKMRPNRKSKYK